MTDPATAAYPGPYGAYPARTRSVHPRAGRSLVLGIVGLCAGIVVLLPLALCPVAAYLGASARRERERDPDRWTADGGATAGLVLGIVGSVLLAATLFIVLVLLSLITLGVRQDTGYGT